MKYVDEKNIQSFKKIDVSSWEGMKDNVYLRLINIKYLPQYGNDIAHCKFLDLAITFSVQEKAKGTLITHLLTNEELSDMGVTIDEVRETCTRNSERDRKRRLLTFKEHTIKNNPMYPVVRVPDGMSLGVGNGNSQPCGIIVDTDAEGSNILMLCNKHETFGASYMAIPSVLEEIYSRFDNENFYIVPMSVHSVMCVRSGYASFDGEKPITEVEDDLLDMVEGFNDSANQSWKDILSYKIYYYLGDDGKHLFPIQ